MKKPAKIQRIDLPVPFPPGSTNCYFIPGAAPALIDPGVYTPDALERLRSGLKAFGSDLGDIERIILTHGHADHAGLAGAAAACCRAPVFVHRFDCDRMLVWSETVQEERARGFRDFFAQAGVTEKLAAKVTALLVERFRRNFSPISNMEFLEGGELIPFDLFELRVLHTPGHTAGSICLFDESEGLLLAGDTLHGKIVPFISTECEAPAGQPPYFALERYQETLDLLGTLPVRLALPGHGPNCSTPRELIARLRRHRLRRGRRILEILRAGNGNPSGMSQFEIFERLFLASSDEGLLYMGISEVRSSLEVMEKEGVVAALTDGGGKRYCPVPEEKNRAALFCGEPGEVQIQKGMKYWEDTPK